MPYINVYVSPVLNLAIEKAAKNGGKDWTRSKWLRKLAQRELVGDAPTALVEFIKQKRKHRKE